MSTSATPLLPLPNLSEPPPNLSVPPPSMSGTHGAPMGPPPPQHHHHHHGGGNYRTLTNHHGGGPPRHHFRPFLNMNRPLPGPLGAMTLEDFDGKRLRKSVMRKTVDYNSSIIKALETRVWQRDLRDRRTLQPDVMYYPDLMPPPSYPDNPINCVTTRFVKTATNKMRCPIFCMAWTPEGRRLVTGASSGEFTLWNGLTFNFETILQAHDSPVRTMVWSHNDSWMVTGDHSGYVKYWQSNMNNVKMFQAHKEALRGISFSPTDSKFVTCSDDGTLRIWDFYRYQEEKVLRGHGADVKCVHWHPQKGLIISGSKDNQQPIKLWDPKSGQSLATLHAHKSTVMDLKWNDNGNWLITASRDHLLKLFDLRNLGQEVQTFRGHKKEASSVAWHPHHEGLFCSGGSDGSIMFWHVGADKEVGAIEQAHDSIVWTLAWHPLGHILCSGSNDHTSKFWTRNRPGDPMRDKYNLNTLPPGVIGAEEVDVDEPSMIPGMGPEDKVDPVGDTEEPSNEIPGLDLDSVTNANEDRGKSKKVPYSKPIPRNFQAQWNETAGEEDAAGNSTVSEIISHIVENTPGVVPLQKISPNAIIVYGKLIPVVPGSRLEQAIAGGPEQLQKFIDSGQIEELHDVMPHIDDEYLNEAYLDEELHGKVDGNDRHMQHARRSTSPRPSSKNSNSPHVWERPPDVVEEEMRASYMHEMEMRAREMEYRARGSGSDGGPLPPRAMFDGYHMGYDDIHMRDRDDYDYHEHQARMEAAYMRNGGYYRNGAPPPPMYMGNGGAQNYPSRMDFPSRGPPGEFREFRDRDRGGGSLSGRNSRGGNMQRPSRLPPRRTMGPRRF